MLILTLAWRNIWRNKVRSSIILLSVSVGLAGGIFAVSFVRGYVDQVIETALEVEHTHLYLYPAAGEDVGNRTLFFQDVSSVLERLRKMPETEMASARLQTRAIISTPHASAGINLSGIVPEMEKRLTKVSELIDPEMGTYFEGNQHNPIVLGNKLAKRLNVRPGSRVVLSFNDQKGDMITSVFFVAGIYNYINSSFEIREAFVQAEDLARHMNIPSSAATELGIRLVEGVGATKQVMALLSELFPENLVQSWSGIRPELGFLHYYVGIINLIVLGIILFAISLGLINMMHMAVMDRSAELGVLRAIGLSNAKVIIMVMYETILLMLLGGFIGYVISIAYIGWLENIGIDLSVYLHDYKIPAKDYHSLAATATRVYPKLTHLDSLKILLMVIATGLFAAWLPAMKAVKTEPRDAIKNLKL